MVRSNSRAISMHSRTVYNGEKWSSLVFTSDVFQSKLSQLICDPELNSFLEFALTMIRGPGTIRIDHLYVTTTL